MSKVEYNRINFMRRLSDVQHRTEKQAARAKRKPLLLPLILLALVMLGAWGALFYQTMFVVQPQINAVNQYMASDAVLADYATVLDLEQQAAVLDQRNGELETARATLESYPQLDGDLYRLLFSKSGGRVVLDGCVFDRASGVISLSGVAVSVTDCAAYVGRLRATARFSDLYYYGYVREIISPEGEEPQAQTDEELDPAAGLDLGGENSVYVFQLVGALPGTVEPAEGGEEQ